MVTSQAHTTAASQTTPTGKVSCRFTHIPR
jgi:hypothetical protein